MLIFKCSCGYENELANMKEVIIPVEVKVKIWSRLKHGMWWLNHTTEWKERSKQEYLNTTLKGLEIEEVDRHYGGPDDFKTTEVTTITCPKCGFHEDVP